MGVNKHYTMTQPCKIAIIGAGYTAREHIKAFADVAGASIVGIHSRTRSRAEALAAEYNIKRVCSSVGELYEQTRADLVVVTVVELSMNTVSQACFEFPWTALLEKPAGYNLADAVEIEVAAREKNRSVFVALNRRFYSSTRAALGGLTDEPRFIKVQDQEDQMAALAAGQPELVVKNWMYANSIHMIDYLRMFGRGTIQQVETQFPWRNKEPHVMHATMKFSSGDTGVYEGVWNMPGPWAVTVATHSKRWELRPMEQAHFQNKGERKLHPVDIHEWDKKFKPGFRLQAEMAVKAALGMPSQSVTLGDSLETMRLIHSIFQ